MGEIKKVGIIGFNVMGSAIGLNAATSGYEVVYKELNDELVKAMYDQWVINALNKRVAKGKMTQEEMDTITARIKGSSRYKDLDDCDIVIEAAVEQMDLKIDILKELSNTCKKDAILVSNTSTFLIEKLMEKVDNPGRTAGLHYFFPANVNRLLEVIRQKNTNQETYEALMAFAEKNGKVAITVKDFPGFAINPVFITSYMVLNSFYGGKYNAATLDDISKKVLGIRFGIMWVQNGSGLGTVYHAGESMVEYLGDTDIGFPKMGDPLKKQFESGQNWNLEDGPILEDSAAQAEVGDRLLGAIFTIATHLIEKEVVSLKDLELGVCTSLAWPKGPFTMMNEMGMEKTQRLVQLAVDNGDFKMPAKFARNDAEPWAL